MLRENGSAAGGAGGAAAGSESRWGRRGGRWGPRDPGSGNGRVGPGGSARDGLWIQLLGNSPEERPVWKRQGTLSRARKQNNVASCHGHRNSLHGHGLERSQAACTLAGAGRRRWDLHVFTRLRARPQMRNPWWTPARLLLQCRSPAGQAPSCPHVCGHATTMLPSAPQRHVAPSPPLYTCQNRDQVEPSGLSKVTQLISTFSFVLEFGIWS